MRYGVEPERIRILRGGEARRGGRYVLYWMQASQRVACNHALNHAVARANALGLPVVVCFGLDPAYPDADERHYAFMLEGLAETAAEVRRIGCAFSLRLGQPPGVALDTARDAALIVCDRGYLRHQVAWRTQVAAEAGCPVEEVESEVVVPVAVAADHALYQARHLRARMEKLGDRFLTAPPKPRPRVRAPDGLAPGLDAADTQALLRLLPLPRRVAPVSGFRGGAAQARRLLDEFLTGKLRHYGDRGSDPAADTSSRLSPYLHFGQIGALEVALQVRRVGAGTTGKVAAGSGAAAFLEELVVRRELAVNHVVHQPLYDGWEGVPSWARTTLTAHAADPRDPCYDGSVLEAAETADPYWNAAMVEMKVTGWLPNHMRMYWGKKLLQWSARPEEGLALAVALNDRWFLDGRDPNSYAGVLWCFGLHDRPWKERPVFGTVRCMTAGGLERKFDMPAYLERVRGLTGWDGADQDAEVRRRVGRGHRRRG